MIRKNLPLIACFTVSFIFSIHFILAKEILKGHTPLALTALRGIFSGMIIAFLFKPQWNKTHIKTYWKKLFFIGFFGFFINQLLFMTGLQNTSPLNASIITNAVPIVTASLAILARLEVFSLQKFLGMFIGFASVLSIIFQDSESFKVHALGDILVFSNMFVFALAIIFIKELTEKGVSHKMITAIMMLVGGGLSLLVVPEETLILLKWSFLSWKNFSFFIFEIIFSTVIAYLLNFYALSKMEPSKITIFIYLQPIITAIGSFYLEEKLPSMQTWAAFLGIFTAGLLVLRTGSKNSL